MSKEDAEGGPRVIGAECRSEPCGGGEKGKVVEEKSEPVVQH